MSDPSAWAAPEAPRGDDAAPPPGPAPGPAPGAPSASPTGWGPPTNWGPPPVAAPGNGTPPGYGAPPTYGPGYGAPPGYGTPGYGPGGWQPPVQRKPGIVPLRPLLFSEILDGAFQAMRTNPRTMIGIAAAVLAITSLITIPVQAGLQAWAGSSLAGLDNGQGADPIAVLDVSLSSAAATIPGALVLQLAVIVLEALLVVAVGSAVLGRRTSPSQLWRRVRRRVPAAIGLALLTWLVFVVVLVVGVGVFVVPSVLLFANDAALPGFVLAVFAFFALIVLLALLAVFTSLAAPALLLEGLNPWRALLRSVRLVRGSFWRTLGILLVAYLVTYIGSLVIGVPVGILSAVLDAFLNNSLHTNFWPNVASAAVTAVGQTAGGAVLHPWWAAIIALVYIDLRMRREGLDLELIRAADAEEAT